MLQYLKLFGISFLFLLSLSSKAQTDSLKEFSIEDFFKQIILHHPVAKQAQLLDKRAQQDLMFAKGLLDPKITSSYYEKDLTGLDYFTIWDNQLKVPVWFGTDIKMGYEKNNGVNLNGENYTPKNGLSYLGVTIPLGQGLIIDERRSVIKQAKLMPKLAEAEKVKLINKLLLQAAKEYWDWSYRYQRYLQLKQSYDFAFTRFDAVKQRELHGDLSAIDTVEALMILQDRDVQMNQALLDYNNEMLTISNYLWSKDGVPLELTNDIIPTSADSKLTDMSSDTLAKILLLVQNIHPEIIKLDTKIKQLGIEQKFNADKLKPKLNVDYNLLQKGFYINNDALNQNYLTQNYKVGLSFSYSLFLRQERSKLSISKIKVLDANYELQQINREITNNIKSAYNEWVSLQKQIVLQKQMLNNAKKLRDSEQQLFENGESSLFLINTREINLINNQIKLNELEAKFEKNKYYLYWCSGNILR